MITIQQAWKLYERYVEAWKPRSADERAAIVTEVFSEELRYLTPEFTGGIETVLEDMEGFQKKFPGAHFEVEDVSAHHDVALFTWVLVQADGNALVKGHDCIRISPENKIVSVTTFAPSLPRP